MLSIVARRRIYDHVDGRRVREHHLCDDRHFRFDHGCGDDRHHADVQRAEFGQKGACVRTPVAEDGLMTKDPGRGKHLCLVGVRAERQLTNAMRRHAGQQIEHRGRRGGKRVRF